MDRVLVEGLAVRARVGVQEWERRRRQKVLLDLELALDLRKAGRRDRVEETVDYAAVARAAKRTAEGKSYRLVEALAEAVAAEILAGFSVREVRVRARKFSVPGACSVGVEITRSRLRKRSASPRGAPR